MGTHGDSGLRLTRQEAAVIPGHRARENVALPEARGEGDLGADFLVGVRVLGVVLPNKRKETGPPPPLHPWVSAVRGSLAMIVGKNRAKYQMKWLGW